jgi:hypothetical protein
MPNHVANPPPNEAAKMHEALADKNDVQAKQTPIKK